jgi:hypothetical protein
MRQSDEVPEIMLAVILPRSVLRPTDTGGWPTFTYPGLWSDSLSFLV